MIRVVLIVLFSFSTACISAQESPCLKVHMVGAESVKFANRYQYIITMQVTNCAKEDLVIDTTDLPDWEEQNEYNMHFSLWHWDSLYGLVPYPRHFESDIDVIPLNKSSEISLKPGQSHSYKFSLFTFYNIREKGTFRLRGWFTVPRVDQSGYYMQLADNFIDITVN